MWIIYCYFEICIVSEFVREEIRGEIDFLVVLKVEKKSVKFLLDI